MHLENQNENGYHPCKPFLPIHGHEYNIESEGDGHEARELNSESGCYTQGNMETVTRCLQRLDAFSILLGIYTKEKYWQVVPW